MSTDTMSTTKYYMVDFTDFFQEVYTNWQKRVIVIGCLNDERPTVSIKGLEINISAVPACKLQKHLFNRILNLMETRSD